MPWRARTAGWRQRYGVPWDCRNRFYIALKAFHFETTAGERPPATGSGLRQLALSTYTVYTVAVNTDLAVLAGKDCGGDKHNRP